MREEALEANRANWDERTPIHLASQFYDIDGWIADGRGPRHWEVEALGDVGGLSLLHLQCHIGLDTLAWARAGASVTGLDFSPRAIEAARDIAGRAGLDRCSRFVCSDVHRAVEVLGGETFDVVYVSLGALCWLPSADAWAGQVGQLVRPGGRFYIHDVHPLAWAMADDELEIAHTYFEQDEPFVDDSDVTYADGEARLTSVRSYEWNHGIGEVVTALIRHGLSLVWLAEHDWTVWRRWPFLEPTGDGRWRLPADRPSVPLTFSLLARR
ncbi:MAG TPA: methyltransferase [Acidimicrobiales bacterium]|nr:methyltransferase [Acidimicrobiales bacterium]